MAQETQTLPPQHQDRQPGEQSEMHPKPQEESPHEPYRKRFTGKTFIVTGGDSGIGASIAIEAAREGARVAIVYLNEDRDAEHVMDRIRSYGGESIHIKGDAGDSRFCKHAIRETIARFGSIDVLVNDAGEQHPQDDITKISDEQLERTFRTNIFSFFFMIRAARPHLEAGSSIVNIASVNAYKGNPKLIDYSATKGAIVSLTRSLAPPFAKQGIRINAVAPGPIWTPLIPSTFPAGDVKSFGADTPMGRPGQPYEVAAGALFLASDDASYITGQTLHINGGTIVNG
jgi:NAD(P)-dependent dehydrogenase (short-subunit alcohol dehydrogenase family)